MPRALGRTKLAKRLRFNLADTLAGDIEFLTDFFEGMFTFTPDAEPKPDNLFFFRGKRFQNIRGLVTNVGIDDGIDGRADPAIFNQIAQRRFSIPADGGLE